MTAGLDDAGALRRGFVVPHGLQIARYHGGPSPQLFRHPSSSCAPLQRHARTLQRHARPSTSFSPHPPSFPRKRESMQPCRQTCRQKSVFLLDGQAATGEGSRQMTAGLDDAGALRRGFVVPHGLQIARYHGGRRHSYSCTHHRYSCTHHRYSCTHHRHSRTHHRYSCTHHRHSCTLQRHFRPTPVIPAEAGIHAA